MAKEPVGRPSTTQEQLDEWLQDMKPFLKQGASLWYAITKAGIEQHAPTVYKFYRQGGEFTQKIDTYRTYTAELANNVFANMVEQANELVKQERSVPEDLMKNVRFFAEKHRTAQKFFVTRNENAEVDDSKVGKVLDNLETDYTDVGRQAEEQMVATDTPVQD